MPFRAAAASATVAGCLPRRRLPEPRRDRELALTRIRLRRVDQEIAERLAVGEVTQEHGAAEADGLARAIEQDARVLEERLKLANAGLQLSLVVAHGVEGRVLRDVAVSERFSQLLRDTWSFSDQRCELSLKLAVSLVGQASLPGNSDSARREWRRRW